MGNVRTWLVAAAIGGLALVLAIAFLIQPEQQPSLLENWERASLSGDRAVVTDATTTEEGFLAVGYVRGEPDTMAAWESTDGLEWTPLSFASLAESTEEEPAVPGRLTGVTSTQQGIVVAGHTGQGGDPDLRLWLSLDQGQSWAPVANDPEVFAGGHIEELVSFSGGYLGVGWRDAGERDVAHVWRSNDGALWERLDPSERPDADERAYASVEGESGVVVAGSSEAAHPTVPVWASADGRSWSEVSGVDFLSEPDVVIRDLVSTSLGTVAVMDTSTAPMAAKTSDLKTWEPSTPFPSGAGGIESSVAAVAKNSEDFLLAVGGLADGQRLAAWVSRDGMEWELVEDPVLADATGFRGVEVATLGRTTVILGQSENAAAAWVHRAGETS